MFHLADFSRNEEQHMFPQLLQPSFVVYLAHLRDGSMQVSLTYFWHDCWNFLEGLLPLGVLPFEALSQPFLVGDCDAGEGRVVSR